MLVGQYSSKLTDKKRLAVPRKIREELGNELVVAKWYERCLILVSKKGWENLLTRVVGIKGLVISPVRDIDRFIFGSAFELSLDNQGRFVLDEILKDYAGITDEVIFVGLGDRVEIWAKTKWVEFESNIEDKANKALDSISKR